MTRADKQRLLHMRVYCREISGFIVRFGKNYDTFVGDRAYFNAVSMDILQIGELANGLSEEFRKETKGRMPWSVIRGMRNWLAHAYAQMDETMIWETAINDIPSLLDFCEEMLNANEA